jgi:hypothetical protein
MRHSFFIVGVQKRLIAHLVPTNQVGNFEKIKNLDGLVPGPLRDDAL